jgi:drug/metabolite transporter (DMT)-like permease
VEIILALVSAALFALGTVLQQRAGAEPSLGTHSGLLLRMARRPVWVAGIACDILGFVAQAAALGLGALAVVQPLLAISVVFALPLGVKLSGQRINRGEVVAAVLVVAALAVFLTIANPSGGHSEGPVGDWLLVGGACVAISAVLAMLGRRGPAPRRAALLGTAAGILFAMSAALTKAVVDDLNTGVLSVLASWELYALAVVGYVSMTINQLALNTGALAPTVASSTAVDPIASVVIGLTVFRETLHTTSAKAIGTAAALILALVGMTVLARAQDQTPHRA